MKTVQLFRDFIYRPSPRRLVQFHGGIIYAHVLEAAARQIESAGAGRILSADDASLYLTRDASHAFRRGKPRREKP
jgi:hypothetical protein